jgi:Spy/CpxP family protein refolding chaperone
MNKSLVAGAALVVGIVTAVPMLAWSASDSPPQLAQAAPAEPGIPGMGGMPGMMGRHGGMMHRMMQLSPRQRCEERLARRAGIIAYTVAKLNLTAEQKPLSDKLQGLQQATADRERQLCAALPVGEGGQQTILDRVNRREQLLSARLQGLQQVKPALEQFYQALTPEQKAVIDHPLMHH